MSQQFFWEAIRDTLAEEMRANPKVLLLSEDAGASATTGDLLRKFGPDRVLDTPGSEHASAGAAVGAALCGYRPVVELRSMNSLAVAANQLVSQAACNRYVSGGQTQVPLVLRTRCGTESGGQPLEAWFAHVPGLLVAVPATPHDAKGLLRTALRHEENPVLFLEHDALYETRGEVPDGDFDVPFGVAALRRKGQDVTVVSYGRMAPVALAACEQVAQENIDAEMIDLRTVQPFDLVAVLESVRKTGRVLLCSEAAKNGNVMCELAMRINEHGFDDLDAPVRRVCALDVPVSGNPVLAAEAIPSQTRIAKAIRELVVE